MKSNTETSNITINLFLKNIKNLAAIAAALDMLEMKYISQNSFYIIINKAKKQFLDAIGSTLAGIELVNERNFKNSPIFNYDQLFLIRKPISAFDSTSDELLKITKLKLDEIVDFIDMLRKNFSAINFPEVHKEKIRQEILIVKRELFN